MAKIKWSLISLALSFLSLLCLVKIDAEIAARYIAASGKTRALFGIIEIQYLGYKFWVGVVAFATLIFSIVAIRKRERGIAWLSAFVSICLILLVFLRFWRWMI